MLHGINNPQLNVNKTYRLREKLRWNLVVRLSLHQSAFKHNF